VGIILLRHCLSFHRHGPGPELFAGKQTTASRSRQPCSVRTHRSRHVSCDARRGGYPFELRVEDSEEVAFKLSRAAVGGGRLFLDQQLDLVVVEVVRSPLRNGPPWQRLPKLHLGDVAGECRGLWASVAGKKVLVDRRWDQQIARRQPLGELSLFAVLWRAGDGNC
jgi:hypothetical protein